jgi:hypothetical protein
MSEKEIKLSPEIRELADKFKAATKVEKDGTSEVETDVFTDTLKEGITKEIVESVYEHRDNCIRAGQLAAGELFVDAMSKNASLDKGTVVYGLGGSDRLNVTVDRTRTYPGGPGSTDGEKIIKYGIISPTIEIESSRNTGDTKRIRNIVAQYAMDKLK